MQIITRIRCVVCDERLPEASVTFKNTPIFMGIADDPDAENDIIVDQEWTVCTVCGCVQLTNLLDPSVLYQSSHSPGTVGPTWNKHHNEFADFVSKQSPKDILEVGAGTTQLAKLINLRKPVDSYTIIDPNVISLGGNVKIIRQLVTPSFFMDSKFDTIVHSHTMEHFYNPVDELKALARLMTDDGQMIVSVPLIINSIIDGHTNGLNFEHTYMTTVSNLYTLFAKAGLHITAMCSFNQYNVFIRATKESRFITTSDETQGNTAVLDRYVKIIKNTVDEINSKLDGQSTVFLFGAHVFSQVLISNGVTGASAILDNDTRKHRSRLYGTDLIVMDPNRIANLVNPIVIVHAGQYTAEITEQLKTINPSVVIV
jgi:SAM-dependent methyltransferase